MVIIMMMIIIIISAILIDHKLWKYIYMTLTSKSKTLVGLLSDNHSKAHLIIIWSVSYSSCVIVS